MRILAPDLCVIGAGAGGLHAVAIAVDSGASVVLVEKGSLGGGWLNSGSVPANAFLAAARRARRVTGASHFGLVVKASIDFTTLREHIERVKSTLAPDIRKERLIGLGVRLVEGAASFHDRRTVRVDSPDPVEIRARRFILATGSTPALPPIAGVEAVPCFNEDTILDIEECPDHLVVLGAEPVGLEFAQAFRSFGAKVTILDATEPLAGEDPECARIVLRALHRDGIAIRTATVRSVQKSGDGIEVVVASDQDEERIGADEVLIAIPRAPNIEGLGLDAARIKPSPRGIVVNSRLQTSNRRVYAIGDVTGARSTQAARHQAKIAVRNALGYVRMRMEDSIVPRVIRTCPELAHVGMSDIQAKRIGAIRVLRWAFRDIDAAQAEGDAVGHIKVVTDRKGTVLGATIVGPAASELIGTWSLAVSQRLNIQAINGTVLPSGTLSEIGTRAASTYLTAEGKSTWTLHLKGLLRRG